MVWFGASLAVRAALREVRTSPGCRQAGRGTQEAYASTVC